MQDDDPATWPRTKKLNLRQLAQVLDRPYNSIRNDRVRNPKALPPARKRPGTRDLFWLYGEVQDWMQALPPA